MGCSLVLDLIHGTALSRSLRLWEPLFPHLKTGHDSLGPLHELGGRTVCDLWILTAFVNADMLKEKERDTEFIMSPDKGPHSGSLSRRDG